MGNDDLYDYVKDTVKKWEGVVVVGGATSISEVQSNMSVRRCTTCGNTPDLGMVQGAPCPECNGDALRSFKLIGSITNFSPKYNDKVVGDVALSPNDFYKTRYEVANPAKVTTGGAKKKVPFGEKKQITEESRTWFLFTIDDGKSKMQCCISNFRWLYPNGVATDDELNALASTVREAFEKGQTVVLKGKVGSYADSKLKDSRPTFFVSEGTPNREVSRMTQAQFEGFLIKVAQSTMYGPSPTPLTVARVELWKPVIMLPHIKDAMMMWCLSPKTDKEMMHIALITASGQGKDEMRREVLAHVAKVGVAEGRNTTEAALVGAMPKDRYDEMSPGLLPLHHNERVVVSEFTEWPRGCWPAIFGVLSQGEITISKGEIAGRCKPACLNMLFFGNPPRDFGPTSAKLDTLNSLGPYTMTILSRFSMVFLELKLVDETQEDFVRQTILNNRQRGIRSTAKGKRDERLVCYQDFYREYFKFVSSLYSNIEENFDWCNKVFNEMATIADLKNFFLSHGGQPDRRKFLQFINICEAYAKLNGRISYEGIDQKPYIDINPSDITMAAELFRRSAITISDNFDTTLLGINPTEQYVLTAIQKKSGISFGELKKSLGMKDKADANIFSSIKTLESLGKVEQMDGKYYYMEDGRPSVVPSSSTSTSSQTPKEEKGTAPVPSPPSLSDMFPDAQQEREDQAGRMADSLVTTMSIEPDLAESLVNYFDLWHTVSIGHFAERVMEHTHGQIVHDVSKRAYEILSKEWKQ